MRFGNSLSLIVFGGCLVPSSPTIRSRRKRKVSGKSWDLFFFRSEDSPCPYGPSSTLRFGRPRTDVPRTSWLLACRLGQSQNRRPPDVVASRLPARSVPEPTSPGRRGTHHPQTLGHFYFPERMGYFPPCSRSSSFHYRPPRTKVPLTSLLTQFIWNAKIK